MLVQAIVIAPQAAFHHYLGTKNYQCNNTILGAFRWPDSPALPTEIVDKLT